MKLQLLFHVLLHLGIVMFVDGYVSDSQMAQSHPSRLVSLLLHYSNLLTLQLVCNIRCLYSTVLCMESNLLTLLLVHGDHTKSRIGLYIKMLYASYSYTYNVDCISPKKLNHVAIVCVALIYQYMYIGHVLTEA